MRSLVVAIAGVLVLAGCAGKADTPPAASKDQPGDLPDGQSAVMPGPNGPVLHIGKNKYPLYPPP